MKGTLGARIKALRKERGITQEELGKNLGLTAQAISNWEGGGAPDAELLPTIADFFGVSIDNLYGKTDEVKNDLGKAILWTLHNTERSMRFEKAFNYCWCINQGIFDMHPQVITDTIKTEAVPMHYDEKFSSILFFEEGISVMRLNDNAHYFCIIPKPKDGYLKFLHKPEEYEALFSLLGKPDYMKTMMFMYGRKKLSLTDKMLAKHLSLKPEEAKIILDELSSRGFLSSNEMETEHGETMVYSCCDYFGDTVSLVPFLFLASNMIEKPVMGFSNTSGTVKTVL